ncbi:MAG: EFR1 family ferrodoxin [Smithellaceae bacterium]|nr:EFR1 family ferrodoxin [Smithellaceae bacterium]
MMNKRVKTFYFSATETTKKIVTGIAGKLAESFGGKIAATADFTLPDAREIPMSFNSRDIVIAGVPVYAGRVPNVLLKYLNTMTGNGALAVAVVVYGNRHYDDALVEWRDILEARGFKVIAAGAFVGEHSFSRILGGNRPDAQDMSRVAEFAGRIHEKLTTSGNAPADVSVPGKHPYRPYYRPKDKDGNPASILKVVPKTNDDCIHCGLCVSLCPMGSIDGEDEAEITGICIKCCACLKNCPVEAKYFDDANFLWHKEELEVAFTSPRREPEFFL